MENEKIFYDSINFPFRVFGNINHSTENTNSKKLSSLHFHEEYEFMYCNSGVFECMIDSVCYRLFPGDIMFINSRIPHETSMQNNTSYIVLQFKSPYRSHDSLRYLRKFLKLSDNPLYIFRNELPETTQLKKCMVDIFLEQENKNNAFEYFSSANIYMIMAILYRYNIISPETILLDSINIDKVLPIIEYTEENFDKQISIIDVADVLNIDKSYFCRLFKKICNCTYTEYLNFVRICKAEHMLKKDLSLSDIAYSVGFSSQSYFNKLFKKHTLYSPNEYKKLTKHQPHDL